MSPDQFWRMHPVEFYWLAEAHSEKQEVQRRKGGLTRDEALEMADELRHARVAAGYPPE